MMYRTAVLQRARDASKLTIPSLIPPDGSSVSTVLPTPYQSVGARGVNNLSAKLLLALFPPNQPFFRMVIGDYDIEQALAGDAKATTEFQVALSKIEREVQSYIEQCALRVGAFEAIKHLIVAGNVLLFIRPNGTMRVFHLKDFVVRRDPEDNVLELITKENISREALPEGFPLPEETAKDTAEKNIELYTQVKREKSKWTIRQEVCGNTIPGSKGTYPLDRVPWLPLRWTRVDGEDYGRGHVEEYQGDLQSLEGLSQSLVQGAAQAARVLWFVNPNGVTKMKTVADAPNGAVREGKEEDVKVLQMQKQADFAVAKQTADDIEKRLSFAFLLNSAIQRDAERVTTAEIRYMAQELDTSLGGFYSVQSQEFQLKLVKVLMAQLQKAGRLPQLPKDLVKPTIVTGLEALGRGNDLDKLNQFMQEIAMLGPQVMQQRLKAGTVIKMVAASLGIETDDLVYSDEEVQQQQQQQQMMEMAQTVAPKVAGAGAKGISDVAVHRAINGSNPAPQGAGKSQPSPPSG